VARASEPGEGYKNFFTPHPALRATLSLQERVSHSFIPSSPHSIVPAIPHFRSDIGSCKQGIRAFCLFQIQIPTNLYAMGDSSDTNEPILHIFYRAINAQLVNAKLRWQDRTKKSLSSLPPRVQGLFYLIVVDRDLPQRRLVVGAGRLFLM